MATVGEILKDARLKQNKSLSDVEKATKIRVALLTYLEEGKYQLLPSSTYARGFVKNYAECLGLEQEPLLARLRRELREYSTSSSKNSLLPKGVGEGHVSFRRIRITGIFLLVAFFILALFSYLFFQYRGFLGAPTLSVDSPREHQIVKESSLVVFGKTEPDATVKINNEFVEVRNDGKFQKNLTLFKGMFTLVITSTNRFGRQTQITRTVTVE